MRELLLYFVNLLNNLILSCRISISWHFRESVLATDSALLLFLHLLLKKLGIFMFPLRSPAVLLVAAVRPSSHPCSSETVEESCGRTHSPVGPGGVGGTEQHLDEESWGRLSFSRRAQAVWGWQSILEAIPTGSLYVTPRLGCHLSGSGCWCRSSFAPMGQLFWSY